ncbi:hypothetical protein O0L34_g12303 [Tuta absoluta]|nr:hypothetical protein O0L34_g12303 [Tuta absoluta]
MSGDAASLPCPVCAHTGVFASVQTLRDRLIAISTNKILCPVCQEEMVGLDKLTIHLFSHVKIIPHNVEKSTNVIPKSENQTVVKVQPKKSKQSVSKNKTTSAPNTPVFVKIYPKLPVIALNTVPVIDISQSQPIEECAMNATKPEALVSQINSTCNICGLQFVDANILRMHRCLIHNIDENSNVNSTRYHCHICPKNFKMRGSLMVHLRVAHYGFSSVDRSGDSNGEKSAEGGADNEISDDKPASLERNENKQWQCDVCRKCFTTKYFLKKHKRLHTGETPYACTQCNKTFTFQQSYHKHLLYHNDEKPHVCNYCGRAFKELSTLHNHQRIHTGEKPFSCETCGKCFRQRVSYLVHRRIHTGAMPYKCTACDKSFRYKVSQRTHKCLAQPPGTVVRQTGDLVEKLKKIHDSDVTSTTNEGENLLPANSSTNNQKQPSVKEVNQMAYPEISEANAELVRRGASLSLEDMVSDNFSLIAEAFMENHDDQIPSVSYAKDSTVNSNELFSLKDAFTPNVEELMDSIPNEDKNVPSPSDILKNLCLSKDDDSIEVLNNLEEEKLFDAKNIEMFL